MLRDDALTQESVISLDHEKTPEYLLIKAILMTYVKDVRDLRHWELKDFRFAKTYRHGIDALMEQVNTPWVNHLCELIGVEHTAFCEGLTLIAALNQEAIQQLQFDQRHAKGKELSHEPQIH